MIFGPRISFGLVEKHRANNMNKPDLHNAAEIHTVPSLLDFVRPIRRPEYNFFPITLQDRPYLLNRLNFLELIFERCLKTLCFG
jgi:hypothetical protein